MPERPRVVIVNTTPIIGLAVVGQLDLLKKLYERVVIPPAVQAEVIRGGRGKVGTAELEQANWIEVVALKDLQRADLLSDLDRGEAEVIALAQELSADLVIIDERLARRHAKRLGLRLTGTLGVLLKAKEMGFVARVKPFIEQLERNGIRLADSVIAEALRLAGEDQESVPPKR